LRTSTLFGSVVHVTMRDTASLASLELTRSVGSNICARLWRYVSIDSFTWWPKLQFICSMLQLKTSAFTYWARFNIPPNTLQVISGTGLRVKWPNQQSQSTEGR